MDLTAVVADWAFQIAVGFLAAIALVVAVLQGRRHASDPAVPGVPVGSVVLAMILVGIPITLVLFALTGLTDRPHTLAEGLGWSLVPGVLLAIVMGAWTTMVAVAMIARGVRGLSVGVVALVVAVLLTFGFTALVGEISSSANATMRARAAAARQTAFLERSSALHLDLSFEDMVYGPRVEGERTVVQATLVVRLRSNRPIELDPESSMNIIASGTYAERDERIPVPARLEPTEPVTLRTPLAFDGSSHAGVAEPIFITSEPLDFRGQQWRGILFVHDAVGQAYQVEAEFTIAP